MAVLLAEVRSPRPLASPHLSYTNVTSAELDILRTAAAAHQRYGPEAVPHYVISKTSGASDVLETVVLLKEVGLLRPAKTNSASTSSRCSRRSPTCAAAGASCTRCLVCLSIEHYSHRARTCRK